MTDLDWPTYADGIGVDDIRELHDAAVEILLHGAHAGPCTNQDMPDEACELHIVTSQMRHNRLERAVQALEENL